MVLLSQLIRTAAITAGTDHLAGWFAGRQGGRWAEQTVGAAIPTAAAHRPRNMRAPRRADADETRRELIDLHQRGVISDEELDALRRRLSV